MSLKKAKELGVEVVDFSGEYEFVEQWTEGNTRIEIRNVKTTDPVTSKSEHYVRKVNIENGQVIWVSETYANRASARSAAAREYAGREARVESG